jgi:hypothetical protein
MRNAQKSACCAKKRRTRQKVKFPVDPQGQNPFNSGHAQIAQSVEQGIENPRVGGSIPSLGTIFGAMQ